MVYVVVIMAICVIIWYFRKQFEIKSGMLYEHKETGRVVEIVGVKYNYVYYRFFPDNTMFALNVTDFINRFKEM